MLVTWSSPYTVREGFATKWRREWCIPKEKLSGFFAFWKPNRFKMLADGFTVKKSEHSGKWYLYETKDNVALFKVFGNTPSKPTPEDNFILSTYTIKDSSGLRPWQIDAAGKLCSAINHWGSACDGSDLGTGKSYSATGVVRELNVPFVIICPKTVIHQWKSVIQNHFHLSNNLRGIINYELLIRGRKDSDIASFVLHRHSKRAIFEWKIPKNTVIIWDEAHRLKSFKTKTSKACMAAYKQGFRMLFLSASIASSPLDIRTIGTCLGLFKTAGEYYAWCDKHGVYQDTWGPKFNNDPKYLKQMHRYLFECRGVRKRRDEIPGFPEAEIIINAYDIDEYKTIEINENYAQMQKELLRLNTLIKNEDTEIVIRLRYRQKIELLKTDLMVELANEGLDAGMSVILFINYTETIKVLSEKLKTNCIFDGKVGNKVRIESLERFQAGKERIILVQSKSGSVGLNMGDWDGKHPRMAIISPDDDAVIIRQCTGRPVRENSKSKSIIKIPFVSNTIEEKVVENMKRKLNNMDTINNRDIDPLKIL